MCKPRWQSCRQHGSLSACHHFCSLGSALQEAIDRSRGHGSAEIAQLKEFLSQVGRPLGAGGDA